MFKLKFGKSKKVFEKLNKMNRKQAYTIGAIVVVLVIALMMLISAATSGDDDSFADMNTRGYDLAQMPFATDEAEKYLLANAYPDMQENGSSLLYSLEEKEQRQEEDEEGYGDNDGEDYTDDDGDSSHTSSGNDDSYNSGSSRGYGGYGGYGGRGGGGSKTEIGTLSSAGMASASGGGINSTYGPSGDFRQFKGREDRGNERPVQLKTDDARRTMAQFRQSSLVGARLNENKMKNAGKALFGGNIQGSDAFTKDGVDLSKLGAGGLTLDTSAPSTTTDLDNLDKKVSDAAKQAQDKKNKDNKQSFWTDLWQGLVKGVADKLIDTFTSGIGDAIVGARYAYLDGKAWRKTNAAKDWNSLDEGDRAVLAKNGWDEQQWNREPISKRENALKKTPGNTIARKDGFTRALGYTNESSKDNNNDAQVGQANEQYKKCIENCKGKNGDDWTNCTKNCG